MRTLAATLFLLLTTPSLVAGQRIPLPVGVGERVLVWAPPEEERRQGIIVSLDSTALVLGVYPVSPSADSLPGAAQRIDTIPIGAIRSLRVYREIDDERRLRSGLGTGIFGAIGGAVIGGVIGYSMPALSKEDAGYRALRGGFYGLWAGGAAGMFFGMLRPSPWEMVIPTSEERAPR